MTTIDLLQALAAALNIPLSTVLLWMSIISGIASPLSAMIPRPSPDSRWAPLRALLDKTAWNFGNAANAPVPPASPHPIVGTTASTPSTVAILALLGALGLAACSTTQLQAEATRLQAVNAIICQIDQAAPVVVQLASTVTVVVAPGTAPEVAAAGALDSAAHATLQAACPINAQLLAAVSAGTDPLVTLSQVSGAQVQAVGANAAATAKAAQSVIK